MSTNNKIPKNTKKILVVSNTIGLLTKARGKIGLKEGFEIHWFSGNYENLPGVTVYTIPPGKHPKLTWIKRTFFIRRLIRKIKPDIVHVFWANQLFMNLVLSRFKPLVVSVMGGDFLPERIAKWPGYVRSMIKLLLNKAQIVTSKSQYMEKVLTGYGVDRKNIRRITWGIDPGLFKPGLSTENLRKKLHIPEGAIVFFSHRLCKPLYNHHVVIEAFSQLLSRTKHNVYLLVSSFNKKEKFIEDLKDQALKNRSHLKIRFLDPIPHDLMAVYYNLATSVISIPWSDGMPQSLYESMACGCFHILGDLPQYREIITDKKNGYYVSIENPKEISYAMEWVLDNPEILKSSAGINRIKVLEIADKDKESDKMNEIYRELIQKYPQ